MSIPLELLDYGVIGLSALILIVFAYFIKLTFKFLGNHTKHHTEAVNDLRVAIKELIILIKNLNGRK